jgi:hypothetical protein
MRSGWQWPPVSTLILARVIGVGTTGCIVASGEGQDGWRARDRDRWERRDDRRGERRDGWDYRGEDHRREDR